jgi:hypothetical protein
VPRARTTAATCATKKKARRWRVFESALSFLVVEGWSTIAADYGIDLLATLEASLSAPVEEYALTAKYHVPEVRPLTK